MGAAAWATLAFVTQATPDGGELAKLLRVGGAIGVALLVLAASARLLRIHEFDEALARVVRRLRR